MPPDPPPPDPPPIAAAAAGAMLQALLTHGGSIVFTIDEGWCIRWINRVPASLGPAELLGRSCLDHLPAEHRATARQAFEQVLRTGQPARCEIPVRGPDGTPAWHLTQVLPLGDGAGAARLLLIGDDLGERRQAERDLRANEARLRALADASTDLVYRMGPDWSEMRRLDGRDIVPDPHGPGRSWLERFIPPEDRERVQAAIDEAIRTGRPFELEHHVRRVDGSLGWTRSRAVPMLDERGGVTEWIGATSDLSARRASEQALAESEERLRLALEAAGEGLWDLDLATGAAYFSPAFHTMLDYAPETMERRLDAALALIHPEDSAVLRRSWDLLCDPGHFVLRFRMRTAGGGHRLIESRGKTVSRGADGRPLRAVGTHVDITERLRLEQALSQSEGQLRALVDGTTDAIFIKDLQGRYLLVNEPALVGARSVADTLGLDDRAFLPDEVAREVMALDRRVMTDGQVVTIQETLELAAGDPRTFLTTKGPLRDEGGRIVGLFGIARDITELKRQEAAQRQALEDSRSLLEMALSGAELGTWDVDLVRGNARYDLRYCAMLGHGPDEIAPTMQGWLDLIHPEDRPLVLEAVRAHDFGETRVYETEHRLRHKDGHWVWVLARGKVLRDAEGRALRAVGTHQDISDRKRASTEGAQLLRQIQALLEGLAVRRGDGDLTPARPAGAAAHAPPVSARQREVLALLAAGLTTAEIARRLAISPETASTHRRDLMRRLGLRNKAELIRYALQHGIEADPAPRRR